MANEQCQNQWMSVIVANWCIWPIFQLINFTYVHASLRVLTTNLMSVAWNCYFCAQLA